MALTNSGSTSAVSNAASSAAGAVGNAASTAVNTVKPVVRRAAEGAANYARREGDAIATGAKTAVKGTLDTLFGNGPGPSAGFVKPRILRGAFVEFGLSLPPLIVPFQFNPEKIKRDRTLSFEAEQVGKHKQSLREYHRGFSSLLDLQKKHRVQVSEETMSFDVRFDASDELEEGNRIVGMFGVAPRLAALELLLLPKNEGLLNNLFGLIGRRGYSFTRQPNPPAVLFIWGRKKILPVNITSVSISEIQHDTTLNPIRATASINLTVIEGKFMPYTYSKAMREAMAALNLINLPRMANTVVPY